jgi:hypothetical protein
MDWSRPAGLRMLLPIFIIAIVVLSVAAGLFLNWTWSAMFAADEHAEPPKKPCDLDDAEQRRDFERRYPPTKQV